MLTLQLLGLPQVRRAGAPLTITRRKSRALLFYLAAHARPLTRDHLLAFFWPDLDRAAAQQTLRTTLHGLRRTLGDDLLVDEGTLALAPTVSVDALAFEMQLAAPTPPPAALEAALALYQGDFLDGFTLADAPAFDDWAAAERERYRHLAVRALTALAAAQEGQGAYPAALATIDRALAFDPLQEDLQRAALRLSYLAGDRAGAIRRYGHLRQLLDDELGVLPMLETRALYDALLADTLPTTPSGQALTPRAPATAGPAPAPAAEPVAAEPVALPFAGREAELAQLNALLILPPTARPLALLEGEPDIGKTRLADEFLQASGTLALAAGAHELEQSLPYQPLIEALRRLLAHPAWPALQAALQTQLAPVWLAEVARLLPELQSGPIAVSGAPDEPRLWEGVHQFLAAVARQHALTVFIDDAHWADASTLALINYLHRRARTDGTPALYLLTARPVVRGTPLASLTQSLGREERLLRLGLHRLDTAAVTRLAEQWVAGRAAADAPPPEPAPTEALAAWLVTASEGNPYVLVELLRYACDQGLVRTGGRLALEALQAAPVVPQSVYSLIASRLARLSEPARRLVDAAVAAGREFEFEVVYRAAGLTEAVGLDALDELRATAMIHPLPAPTNLEAGPPPLPGQTPLTYYAFDHSLTMEVAYRETGEPRHRRMHRRVAEALEQVYGRQRLDAVAGVLAFHFAEGHQPERAAPYAFRAGEQAARLAAWPEAAAFFEQALAVESDPRQRQTIAARLAEAHFAAGHVDPAAEAMFLALNLARDLGDAERIEAAELFVAQVELSQGRWAEVIRRATRVLPTATSALVTATAEFLLSTAYSIEGADLDSATAHLQAAERALTAAIAQGLVGPGRLAQVRFEMGSVAAQRGDLPAVVAFYRAALALADASDDEVARAHRVLAHNNLAYHLHLLDPHDPEAGALAEAGLALAQGLGLLTFTPYLYSTLGEIRLGQGDLDEAERYFNLGLREAERLPMPERIAGLTANLGLVARARGQTSVALFRLSAAMAQADALGTHHLAAQIRLWLVPLLPPAEARARLAEVRAFAAGGGRARLLAEASALEQTLPA